MSVLLAFPSSLDRTKLLLPLLLSLLLSLAVATTPSTPPATLDKIRAALDHRAAQGSAKYNCTIALAFVQGESSLAVAKGISDFATGRAAQASDRFAWGSGTKPLTGASILKLVSEGHFKLDDPVAPLVDPYLKHLKDIKVQPKQNFTSLRELLGPGIDQVTVRQLLAMQSGIPDFDTAKPDPPPMDPLRAELYASPAKGLDPIELLMLPWVATGELEAHPHYSSTNFVVLGLVLCRFRDANSWTDLKQEAFIASAADRGKFDSLAFAIDTDATLADFSLLHGYDRTSYNGINGTLHPHDTRQVAGVFSGFTASDVVMDVKDAARLAFEIYGPTNAVAPPELVAEMVPTGHFYGLATFNLTDKTGQPAPLGTSYGHLGATYGFQSIMSYHPHLDFAMAVATNIERDHQDQPADVMCQTFNDIAGILIGKTTTCTFTAGSYFGGTCKCDGWH